MTMVTSPMRRGRGRPKGSTGRKKIGLLSSSPTPIPTPRRSSKRLANKAANNSQEFSRPGLGNLSLDLQHLHAQRQNITRQADGITRTTMGVDQTRRSKQNEGATLGAEHMQYTLAQTYQSQDGCFGAFVEEANLQLEEVVVGPADSFDGENAANHFNNCTRRFDDRVSVNAYRVRPQNAELLRTILSKHGDIGANCSLGSIAARSVFMDLVCEILHELMATNLAKISVCKIKTTMASLTDVEKEGIEIGWLKTRLDDILEAKQAVSLLKPSNLKHLEAERKTKLQRLREQLNAYEKDLSIKMTEVCTLRGKIKATRGELSQEADEIRKIKSKISESKAKLGHVVKLGTLVGDLV